MTSFSNRRTVLISILLLLCAYSGYSQSDAPEDRAFRCMNEQAKKRGVDLAQTLEQIEKGLVSDGLLPENSGSGYTRMLSKVSAIGKLDRPLSASTQQQIDVFYSAYGHDECTLEKMGFTEEEKAQTRFPKLEHAMESLTTESDWAASNLAKVSLKVFDLSDLERPMYRSVVVVMVLQNLSLEQDAATANSLLTPESSQPDDINRTTMVVKVGKDGKVSINGKATAPAELSMRVNELVYFNWRESPRKIQPPLLGTDLLANHHIFLEQAPGASDEKVQEVLDELIESHDQTRNLISQELTGIPFYALSRQQKLDIYTLVPTRISKR